MTALARRVSRGSACVLLFIACAQAQEPAAIRPQPGGSAVCKVSRIVDGDTFVCEGGTRIRLLLVDADERAQSVYADSATHLVRSLLPAGSSVRLDFDVQLNDRYGRLLAYVYADAINVNRELARKGLARLAVYPPNVRLVEAIRAAADSARSEKRGIWSGSAFECTPADYRSGACRVQSSPTTGN